MMSHPNSSRRLRNWKPSRILETAMPHCGFFLPFFHQKPSDCWETKSNNCGKDYGWLTDINESVPPEPAGRRCRDRPSLIPLRPTSHPACPFVLFLMRQTRAASVCGSAAALRSGSVPAVSPPALHFFRSPTADRSLNGIFQLWASAFYRDTA